MSHTAPNQRKQCVADRRRSTPSTLAHAVYVRILLHIRVTRQLHGQWLDDDEDPIQISTDAELADAMEIAGKARDSWPRSKGALLVVHVRASGEFQ